MKQNRTTTIIALKKIVKKKEGGKDLHLSSQENGFKTKHA